MLPRFRRLIASSTVLIAFTFGAASCERVPLLAPTGSTITLTSTASALPFNGSADIIAQVIEASGTPPHSGTKITFTTNLGTFQTADAETDVGGRVVVKFLAGTTSGTANIIALSGGVNSGTTTSGTTTTTGNALKIAIGEAAVATVVMNASPSVVRASGGSSTITAKVADAGGNALAGIPVAFTTDAGSLSSSSATSDATGSASVTLTTNRTAKVTGTAGVGTTSGTTTTTPSAVVTVTANATTTITIGAASPSPVTVGQTVFFPVTYTTPAGGSPVARVSVDWGDGRTSSYTGQTASIAHSYTSDGSYLIVVTATDTVGDLSSATVALTVGPRPRVGVTISAATASGITTFTLTETPTTGNSITSVSINFGDGTSLSLSGPVTSVQHSYTSAGTYTATVTATDSSGATGSASTVFTVSGGGASFTFTPATPAHGVTVAFDASASTPQGQIVDYAWDWGDGTAGASGSSSTQGHAFATLGTYNVRLTITDTSGRTSSAVKQVPVS